MTVLYAAVILLGAWVVFNLLMLPVTHRRMINRRARSNGYRTHFNNVIVISNNINSNNDR